LRQAGIWLLMLWPLFAAGCASWSWRKQPAEAPRQPVSASAGEEPASQAAQPVEPRADEEVPAPVVQQVQEYIQSLPIDDLQAKLTRHGASPQVSETASTGSSYDAPSIDIQSVNMATAAPARQAAPSAAPNPPLPTTTQPVGQPEPTGRNRNPAATAAPPVQKPAAPQGTRIIDVDISPIYLSTAEPAPQAATSRPVANVAEPQRQPHDGSDFKSLLAELRRQARQRPDSIGAALRLRLAQWLLQGSTGEVTDWPLKDREKKSLAEAIWKVLQAAEQVDSGPSPQTQARFVEALQTLEGLLARLQPLRIPFAAFCRSVSSFGCYDALPEPVTFEAGRTHLVVLYYELVGFRSEPAKDKKGWFRTLLNQKLAIMTESGREIWTHRDEDIEDLCRRYRRDFFVTRILRIPANLAPGKYVLRVTVEDKLANQIAETLLRFEVK